MPFFHCYKKYSSGTTLVSCHTNMANAKLKECKKQEKQELKKQLEKQTKPKIS